MRERIWRVWLVVISVIACVGSMTVVAAPSAAWATPVTTAAAEQDVVTPKGPEFRDGNDVVYIPSDQGVRYHIYTYANGEKTEVVYPDSGLEYAKPGSYGAEQGLDPNVLVVVTAVSAGSATVLEGTTTWAHLFEPATERITYDDMTTTISFPQLDGVSFFVDGVPVDGNTFQATGGSTVTITGRTTVEEAPDVEITGLDLTHKFPVVTVPKGPQFNDNARTVYIPSDQGVRYYIVIDGRTITKDGLEYSKPGMYTADDGIVAGKLITVDAKSAGSSTVLTGTTHWEHMFVADVVAPVFDDMATTVTIPAAAGIDYYIDANTEPSAAGVYPGTEGQGMTVTAKNVSTGAVVGTWNHTFATKTTPKGPTFNANNETVYIPSDQGVRYYIVIDGRTITKDGLEYSKPGMYTADDGIVAGKLITVDAKSAGSSTVLIGTTHWETTFPIKPTAPTFNDENTSVWIPKVDGVKYYIDGGRNPASAGFHSGKQGKKMTVEAKNPETGEVLATWTHTFAFRRTPEAPKFDDVRSEVVIPSAEGMHYTITIDGVAIVKDGLEFSKPGTYTAADGIVTGKLIVVDAKSAGSSTILTGTTHWEHTLPVRPDYSLQNGDEFNDESPLVNTHWKVLSQKASNLKAGTNVLYTPNGITVKDGQLNIITERHCLAVDRSGKVTEEPSEENLHPEPCGSGERTVYTSGRIESGFDYSAPFEMEVRAYLDPTNAKGMHFAAWIRNNQPYCGKSVSSSNIAELDTMEVYGDQEATTNTSHVTCVAGDNGEDRTARDFHTQKQAIKGKWNTYKMVYDGYSVEYFFNGKAVPRDDTTDSKTVGKTLGISQSRFRNALNNYPWQLILDTNVMADGQWKPAPDDDKRFDTRVDKIDYVRIKSIPDVQPHGAIETYWSSNGGASGWLGIPTGAELSVRGGASQTFQGGTVFWNAATGETHAVKGGVRDRYAALNWEQGWLGFPTSEEMSLNGGASQTFQGGQIHWSGATGAYATRGAIQSFWASQGWQDGWLGYPTGDELTVRGGASQTFQGGTVFWNAATGETHAVKGGILSAYGNLGYEQGRLGFPTSEEINDSVRPGEVYQNFQHGQIHWRSSSNSTYVS